MRNLSCSGLFLPPVPGMWLGAEASPMGRWISPEGTVGSGHVGANNSPTEVLPSAGSTVGELIARTPTAVRAPTIDRALTRALTRMATARWRSCGRLGMWERSVAEGEGFLFGVDQAADAGGLLDAVGFGNLEGA